MYDRNVTKSILNKVGGVLNLIFFDHSALTFNIVLCFSNLFYIVNSYKDISIKDLVFYAMLVLINVVVILYILILYFVQKSMEKLKEYLTMTKKEN